MTVKKVVIVTVIALVVAALGLLVAGVVYVRNYSPYAPALQGTSNIAIAAGLERELQNRGEYVPPSSENLTDEQISRFLQVERQVEQAIGSDAATFQASCESMERARMEEGGLSVQRALTEVGRIGSPFREAKRAQIDAMNAARFSKDEYEWVRRELYAAARIDLSQLDLDALRNFKAIDERVGIRVRRPRDSVAAEEARRVEAHVEELRRWKALAFFGL